MGIRGIAALGGCVVILASCAQPGDSGTEVSVLAVPGTRVEGSVQLVEASTDGCWAVRFKEDGVTVEVPLALDEEFSTQNAVMANPADPGHDFDGPALIDPSGNLLGFANTGVIVSGVVVAADDPSVAEPRDRCGWDVPALLPAVDGGVYVDPDGLTTTTLMCQGSDPASGLENDPASPIDRDKCVAVTQEPWD